MAGEPLNGPPPMPGMGVNPGGGPSPSFKGLAGNNGPMAGGGPQPNSPGAMQIGAGAMKMALEIDQALKLLAQAVPTIGPWVEQTVMGLRQQMGQAMSSGIASDPTPTGSAMPDGSQNL